MLGSACGMSGLMVVDSIAGVGEIGIVGGVNEKVGMDLPGEAVLCEVGEEGTLSRDAGKLCSLKITLRETYIRPV